MVILTIILVQVLCCHLITKITRNGINGAMFVSRSIAFPASFIAWLANKARLSASALWFAVNVWNLPREAYFHAQTWKTAGLGSPGCRSCNSIWQTTRPFCLAYKVWYLVFFPVDDQQHIYWGWSAHERRDHVSINVSLNCVQCVTNMTLFMPFRVILVIEWQHNTWTNMIVKMTILRLLGSSDDKVISG